MLIGSLSNDLFRVASLKQRGSDKASLRFLQEAKKWSKELSQYKLKSYISDIVMKINAKSETNITLKQAENYLMYGILLQNYALKTK